MGGKPEAASSVPGEGGRCNPSSSLGLVDFPAWTTVFKFVRTLYFQRSSKGKRNKIKTNLIWLSDTLLCCVCDAFQVL